MTELPWMAEARRHVGLKEIVGAKHNPIIQSWLKEMGNFPNAAKAWYADDETPWCGLFVGYCLGKSGRGVIKDWYRAKAWAEAGLTKLAKLVDGKPVKSEPSAERYNLPIVTGTAAAGVSEA